SGPTAGATTAPSRPTSSPSTSGCWRSPTSSRRSPLRARTARRSLPRRRWRSSPPRRGRAWTRRRWSRSSATSVRRRRRSCSPANASTPRRCSSSRDRTRRARPATPSRDGRAPDEEARTVEVRASPSPVRPPTRARRPEGRPGSVLRLARGAGGGAVLLLATDVGLQAGGLAAQLAQVVELGAAAAAAAHDRDLADQRRREREDALDALAERHLADRDGAAGAPAVLAGDDDALEGLDARAVALGHLVVDADRVAGVEVGDVVAQVGLLDRAQDGAFVVLHLRFSIPGGLPLSLSSRRRSRPMPGGRQSLGMLAEREGAFQPPRSTARTARAGRAEASSCRSRRVASTTSPASAAGRRRRSSSTTASSACGW